MLQQSALTGILFLAGVCTNSWLMVLGGIIGSLSGMIAARLCRYQPEDIAHGLYGFNGALVGIALLFYFTPGALSFFLILLGGVLSSLLMRRMLRYADHFPPYTAPFILSTWAMSAIAELFKTDHPGLESALSRVGDVFVIFKGLGQVMFQDSWIAGVFFLIGLFLHSRHAAAWGLLGSAAGFITARGFGYPEDLVGIGIYGFNGVLAGIALSDRFQNNAMMPLAGVVLSVMITRAFQVVGIPALTAPFVLSTWAVILLDRKRFRAIF